jgi:3-phenylpropionate/trans-cinnamate dioxygenase ferredoxin subunit
VTAVRACSLADLPEVGALRVDLGGEPVAVVRDEEGHLHAIDDTCSHAQVSLSEGEVEGCAIECWVHGSRFDLRTGRPLSLPATEPVAVYPLYLNGQDVMVDVDQSINPENPGPAVVAALKES